MVVEWYFHLRYRVVERVFSDEVILLDIDIILAVGSSKEKRASDFFAHGKSPTVLRWNSVDYFSVV